MKTKSIIITAVILCLLIALSSVMPVMGSAAVSVTMYGDANENSQLDISDVSYIQQALAKLRTLSDQALINAKVTDGINLSITDATLIQQKLAKLIDKFPVETIEPSSEESSLYTQPTTESTTETTEPETESTSQSETEEPVDHSLKNIDIYFSNNKSWTNVNIYIFNSSTGSAKSEWPGDKMTYVKTNDYGEKIYKTNIDLEKYDRVIFSNNGSDQTTDTPVSAASSGFFINKKGGTSKKDKWVCGLYPYDESDEGTIKTVNLSYPKSATYKAYNKKIFIWLPKDYSSSKKYSVLYMLDGQNIFGTPNGSVNEWEADETAISLHKNTGEDIIVVGIDNSVNRDSELTPPITDTPTNPQTHEKFTTPTGDVFNNFVINTVIPYVEENYPTNGIRGIAGSSSGGIEAFYIGMENRNMFRYIGALSPAFLLFGESDWHTYLETLDFSKGNMPKLHIFFGNCERDLLEQAIYNGGINMENWLIQAGYNKSKILTTTDNDAYHNELFWAVVLPETVSFGLSYNPQRPVS